MVLYDGWDISVTLRGNILNPADTLSGVGVSDNDTMHVHCRLRGGSKNMDIPGQWQCENCSATRCWPVRRNRNRCGAPRPDNPPTPAPWNAGKIKGRNRGPLGAAHGELGASGRASERTAWCWGGIPPPAAENQTASEDLLEAIKLLQAVISKYEKMVVPPLREERTKEREQLLWERAQYKNRLRKLEAGHVEQIAKLEADAAIQRTMLQDVREQLEALIDEVCALRALVADPSFPSGPPPEPAPLPAPRTLSPPQSQDLLDIVHPPPDVTQDQDMENCERTSGNRYLRLEAETCLGRECAACESQGGKAIR